VYVVNHCLTFLYFSITSSTQRARSWSFIWAGSSERETLGASLEDVFGIFDAEESAFGGEGGDEVVGEESDDFMLGEYV